MLAGAKEALANALAAVAAAGADREGEAIEALWRLLEECFLAASGRRSPGSGVQVLRLVCALYVARVAGTTEAQEDAFAEALREAEARLARGEARAIDSWIEAIKGAFAARCPGADP